MKEVKILLIDDNPIDAKLAHIYLGQSTDVKAEMVHALSLSEGLKQMTQDSNFDIMFLDLSLPDSSELDTLSQAINALPYSLPIVVLTGVEDHEIIIGAKEMGASDFLLKDHVNTESLTRVILETLV